MNSVKKTIAFIASLDTKLQETEYAREQLIECACNVVVIDISTGYLLEGRGDISPEQILEQSGISWREMLSHSKAERIEIMSKALGAAVLKLCREKRFDGILSIGGGQNARMASSAMKQLPFGLPKVLVSSLACGNRTLEQFVGTKDIFVMHSVADIAGLNEITKTVISNACHAVAGMAQGFVFHNENASRIRIGVTALGITSKGVSGVLGMLPDSRFEKICFHANGTGGKCMEELMDENKFDLILDMTLHEIASELLGGYCTGAENRLLKAAGLRLPSIIIPGAIDMVDYHMEKGSAIPKEAAARKKVYHNAEILHTKILPEEAELLAITAAERINQYKSPVTLILPLKGFCEASAPGGEMYDPESDECFIRTVRDCLNQKVKVIEVDDNINGLHCQNVIVKEIIAMADALE